MDTILIIEDERPFAQVVEGYLKRLEYGVAGIVDCGEDALRAASDSRPSLALMDIEIRGSMDGFDLAERFHKEFDIPVIFLTGKSDDQTLERVRRSESFGYLLKPFRPEELKASIELALIRHGHEAQLKKAEQSFAAAIKSLSDAVILSDTSRVVTSVNPAAERLTGCPTRKAVGRPLESVFQICDGNVSDVEALEQLFRSPSRGAFLHEVTLRTAAGRELPVEVTVATVRDEVHGPLGSVLVFRDITERKRFEAELKASQAELRALAGHVESAREAERTRIAREVHDELAQLLTGFKIDLAWLEKRLSDPAGAPAANLLQKVRSMSDLLREMVQSVRRIAAELRPGVLDNLGLAAAVEWQAKDFEQRTGIPCAVRTAISDRDLPRLLTTAVFRILQESLTNAARHANAKSARVDLAERDGSLVLEVCDDGRGIRDEEIRKTGAFGLIGMRERVMPLRGTLEIQGKPGEGTVVRVTVPV